MTDEEDERRESAGIDTRGIHPPAAYSIGEPEMVEGVRLVVLRGELDLAAAPELRERIDDTPAGGGIVLDFSHTTFIDSAVLKELLRARSELAVRDARLVLAGVPQPVRRLLDLTRTSELFDDAPDASTAVRLLSG